MRKKSYLTPSECLSAICLRPITFNRQPRRKELEKFSPLANSITGLSAEEFSTLFPQDLTLFDKLGITFYMHKGTEISIMDRFPSILWLQRLFQSRASKRLFSYSPFPSARY